MSCQHQPQLNHWILVHHHGDSRQNWTCRTDGI